ncbi:MAG TPA: DUF5996 family protein [Gemmatimonadales bacterium]|nr:DUF5996 family protein [Gemmatimonadales bacterium]
MTAPHAAWPPLPLAPWQATYETLHMWTQVVGKTCLALAPMANHWWQVALRVTPRGLATAPLPHGEVIVTVELDFLDHRLEVRTSDGAVRTLPLAPQSVADFYGSYTEALRSLGIAPRIRAKPVEVPTAIPFAEDRTHASYDADAAHRWWRVLLQADRVLRRFGGRFQGKQSPVHFFWGSFDFAATRFSGRPAPLHPGGAPNCPDWVMVEAYSRECSSVGFWPGGGPLAEPVFYAYAYPEPAGYAETPVRPDGARYDAGMREFILPYEAVRCAAAPDEALLAFCQSTYAAAADRGDWDRAVLDRPRTAWP